MPVQVHHWLNYLLAGLDSSPREAPKPPFPKRRDISNFKPFGALTRPKSTLDVFLPNPSTWQPHRVSRFGSKELFLPISDTFAQRRLVLFIIMRAGKGSHNHMH